MKDQAAKNLASKVTNINAAIKQSLEEMQTDSSADRLQMDKAAAASMRSLEIDQKLPADQHSFVYSTQIEVCLPDQRRIDYAIKGAGSSDDIPIELRASIRKGAPGQIVN